MFKSSNYKDIDEFVILDFYKEFKNKIEILKNKIITDDDDIKKSIEQFKYDNVDKIYGVNTNNEVLFEKIIFVFLINFRIY